jgi:peptidoglycan LD-endopeptidase CwlK
MKESFLFCFLLIFASDVSPSNADSASSKADAFVRAYPNFFSGYQDNTLLCRDGSGIRFDDGRPKTYEELLSDADPEDELNQSYPTGPQSYGAPAVNFDPGRYRCATLFKKMYGANAKEVESHLTTILWLPHSSRASVRITRVNGVDRQLEAVSAELDQLPPEEKKYVLKTGGTFNWRPIAGSDQLSAHSFGIAIDIDPEYSDYWRWNAMGGPEKLIPYRNRIPHRIVEIFERHGFIWGGKWYHYDTMHFEYRPEILQGVSGVSEEKSRFYRRRSANNALGVQDIDAHWDVAEVLPDFSRCLAPFFLQCFFDCADMEKHAEASSNSLDQHSGLEIGI